jgi:hypothetical protein
MGGKNEKKYFGYGGLAEGVSQLVDYNRPMTW